MYISVDDEPSGSASLTMGLDSSSSHLLAGGTPVTAKKRKRDDTTAMAEMKMMQVSSFLTPRPPNVLNHISSNDASHHHHHHHHHHQREPSISAMDLSPRLTKATIDLSHAMASPSSPKTLQSRVVWPQPNRKRRRRLNSPSASRNGSPVASKAPSPSSSPAAARLDSCHICRRRPTTKAQLSSYLDCEACGRRACYICLRECEGPCRSNINVSRSATGAEGVHGRKICSTCCIETGEEGTIWCLDCYGSNARSARMQNGGAGFRESWGDAGCNTKT